MSPIAKVVISVQASEKKKYQYLSPIFVGLLGHRRLNQNDIPRLQAEFDQILENILDKAGITPIVVLTPVAEGADRLIFTSKHRDRVRIFALLPLEIKEYEKDFLGNSRRSEFHEVLELCDQVIDLHQYQCISSKRMRRPFAYRNTARWISDNCSILITLWNGRTPKAIGGTADIISYRITQFSRQGEGGSSHGSLLHILADNSTSIRVKTCQCSGHIGLDENASHIMHEINTLNETIGSDRTVTQDSLLESFFEHFDLLATKLRNQFILDTRLLTILGILTINFAAIQRDTLSIKWLGITLIFGLITLTFWRISILRNIKSKYEKSRLVAEFMRIQMLWNSSGIKLNQIEGEIGLKEANSYLSEYIFGLIKSAQLFHFSLEKRKDLISKQSALNWITDQITYLQGRDGKSGAIRKNQRLAKRYSIITRVAIAFAFFALVLTPILLITNTISEDSTMATLIRGFFTLSISISVASAAYAQVMGFKDISKRYEVSLQRFKLAQIKLINSEFKEDQEQVIIFIGSESLAESTRWLQIRSEREVKPFQS